ncbi:MAG: hypothetical protein H7A35_03120 [Planctomycetales bacterium]|nr:hypothetical protein [bacterium]UNM09049.1 MAG: hypothetical protein H7A35_03120 [Planctomycetales bacterium]
MYRFHDENGLWRETPGLDRHTLKADESLAYGMGELAARAVADAGSYFGEDFDYSPASLPALDRVLYIIYRSKPSGILAKLKGKLLSEDEIYGMAMQWGAYLGEVLRLHHGFSWTVRHSVDDFDEGEYMFRDSLYIAPLSKVFKRLADGPADDIKSYYYMLLEQSGDQDSVDWGSWPDAGEH